MQAVQAVDRLVRAFAAHAGDGFTEHMTWRNLLADLATELERRRCALDQVRRIDRVLELTAIPDPDQEDIPDPDPDPALYEDPGP